MQALGRQKEEDQKFKASLDSVKNLLVLGRKRLKRKT